MSEPETIEEAPRKTAPLDREQQAETAEPAAAAGSETALVTQRGKPGPRMTQPERDLLLKLLVAGQRESLIFSAFEALGYQRPSSSTLNYYRFVWREQIREAKTRRIEQAMTEGLALKAERVAKLKEHAELLEAMRFTADKNGRLWNERAWRQTLGDIAAEMGERRPAEGEGPGEVVKIIVGIDPEKV